MNYQPNYYNNPYLSYYYPQQSNTIMPQQQQQWYQQQQAQQQQSQIAPQMTQTMPPLNGKIVDSEDMVKVTEVPVGGYGIFPKADLNEIYIKAWNNNGTTSITTYRPVPVQVPQPTETTTTTTTELLEHIQKLESKIDSMLERGSQVMNPVPMAAPQLTTPIETKPLIEQKPKKEVPINAF